MFTDCHIYLFISFLRLWELACCCQSFIWFNIITIPGVFTRGGLGSISILSGTYISSTCRLRYPSTHFGSRDLGTPEFRNAKPQLSLSLSLDDIFFFPVCVCVLIGQTTTYILRQVLASGYLNHPFFLIVTCSYCTCTRFSPVWPMRFHVLSCPWLYFHGNLVRGKGFGGLWWCLFSCDLSFFFPSWLA